jgi:hypothetical protein
MRVTSSLCGLHRQFVDFDCYADDVIACFRTQDGSLAFQHHLAPRRFELNREADGILDRIRAADSARVGGNKRSALHRMFSDSALHGSQ